MTSATKTLFCQAMEAAKTEGCDIMILSFDPCDSPAVEAFSTMERKRVALLARHALGIFAEEPQSPIISN